MAAHGGSRLSTNAPAVQNRTDSDGSIRQPVTRPKQSQVDRREQADALIEHWSRFLPHLSCTREKEHPEALRGDIPKRRKAYQMSRKSESAFLCPDFARMTYQLAMHAEITAADVQDRALAIPKEGSARKSH